MKTLNHTSVSAGGDRAPDVKEPAAAISTAAKFDKKAIIAQIDACLSKSKAYVNAMHGGYSKMARWTDMPGLTHADAARAIRLTKRTDLESIEGDDYGVRWDGSEDPENPLPNGCIAVRCYAISDYSDKAVKATCKIRGVATTDEYARGVGDMSARARSGARATFIPKSLIKNDLSDIYDSKAPVLHVVDWFAIKEGLV